MSVRLKLICNQEILCDEPFEQPISDFAGRFIFQKPPVFGHVGEIDPDFRFQVDFSPRRQPTFIFEPLAGLHGEAFAERRIEKDQIERLGVAGQKTKDILIDDFDSVGG